MTTPTNQQTQSESPRSSSGDRSFNIWALVVIPLVAAILGAALGYFGSILLDQRNNKVRTLYFERSVANDITHNLKPNGDPVNVQVGTQTVNGLSSVKITLYNNTDRNFGGQDGDVPLWIEFIDANGNLFKDKADFKYLGADGETAHTLDPKDEPKDDTLGRFRYKLHSVNSGSRPVFSATYYFQGLAAPDARVKTDYREVEIDERVLTAALPNKKPDGESDGLKFVGIGAITLIFIAERFRRSFDLYLKLKRKRNR